MLDNRLGYAFTDKPFFNVDFIRVNGIKEIHGQFTYKKPGEVMRTTEYYYVYGFDQNGRLSFSYETKKDDDEPKNKNVLFYRIILTSIVNCTDI